MEPFDFIKTMYNKYKHRKESEKKKYPSINQYYPHSYDQLEYLIDDIVKAEVKKVLDYGSLMWKERMMEIHDDNAHFVMDKDNYLKNKDNYLKIVKKYLKGSINNS